MIIKIYKIVKKNPDICGKDGDFVFEFEGTLYRSRIFPTFKPIPKNWMLMISYICSINNNVPDAFGHCQGILEDYGIIEEINKVEMKSSLWSIL